MRTSVLFLYVNRLKSLNDSFGIAADNELLVGGDNVNCNLGVVGRDLDDVGLTESYVVYFLVDLDSEVFHILANDLTEAGVVLAETCGEYNGVKAVHNSGVGADELLDLVLEHINSELRGLVVGVGGTVSDSLLKVTGVGREALGKTNVAALLVHVGSNLISGHIFLLHDVGNDSGVDVAATCAHKHACKGSEAHRGIHNLAVLDSGDGGTVTDVAGYDLGTLSLAAEKLDHLAGNVAVRGSVCAVATDAVLFVHVVCKTVHISLRSHCLMECGVKYENLGNVLHNCETTLDTLNVRTGVKGCIVIAELELLENLIGEEHGLGEVVAAVDDSVADSLDLGHISDNADLLVGESVDYDTNSVGVGCDGKVLLGASVFNEILVVENANVLTDTFADTLCLDRVISGVKKLILERAGACVYNEQFHLDFSSVKIEI